MVSEYICELCGKIFGQKVDYDRHKSRTSPCITVEEIQRRSDRELQNANFRNKFSVSFRAMLDILRNNETLIGVNALRTLAYFINLKLLEPKLGENLIDIDNYSYDLGDLDLDDEEKRELVRSKAYYCRFSNLSELDETMIPREIEEIWNIILSRHPVTSHIFKEGSSFNIKKSRTYRKIIDKLNTMNFELVENDILGDAYEEVVKDILVGKHLGQFFTPKGVKNFMINLIRPQLKKDGTIETIYDPAMGTGGFLISSIQYLKEQSRIRKVNLNWDFICNGGIGGREPEPDTFQLCSSNMLIATGNVFNSLEEGDSIREPIRNKYDIVLANPPFGIDGLDYFDIDNSGLGRINYIPIKSHSAVPLFLQAIIHILNINGRCAVVLPRGQELFSKNKVLVNMREYLMKTCDLKEIYHLPPVFTNTTISTCVFYFVKKRDGENVIKVETKMGMKKGVQKELTRNYKFSKNHMTDTVKFYDYNPENDQKNLLVEAKIADIASNFYSLNYSEYLRDEIDESEYCDDIVVSKLEDLLVNVNTSKTITTTDRKNGEYDYFSCSRDKLSVNKFDYEGEYLIQGSRGTIKESVFYTNSKFAVGTSVFLSKIKDSNECNLKYIYYVLKFNPDYYQISGAAVPMISKNTFYSMKIPVPPITQQNEIVEILDSINEDINHCKESIERFTKNKHRFLKSFIKIMNCEKTKIEDICQFLGKSKRQASYGKLNGNYPFFTSSQSITKFVDDPDYDAESLIIGTGGFANVKYGKKFSCSTDNIVLTSNKVDIKFLYYYLLININLLQNGFVGTGLKHISKEYIKKIKISVPSVNKQREIVEYCEKIDNAINREEDLISMFQKNAEKYFNQILSREHIEVIEEQPQQIEEPISKKPVILTQKRKSKKRVVKNG